MLPNFRGNLSGNRLDIRFMNILFIKLSVDGNCTASVATGDPGNDTQNHAKRHSKGSGNDPWLKYFYSIYGVCGHQQNIRPKMTRATTLSQKGPNC